MTRLFSDLAVGEPFIPIETDPYNHKPSIRVKVSECASITRGCRFVQWSDDRVVAIDWLPSQELLDSIKTKVVDESRPACFMPKVNGTSFRCDCLCNVFQKRPEQEDGLPRYKCNACGANYVWEYA